jgi:hypothetical protein
MNIRVSIAVRERRRSEFPLFNALLYALLCKKDQFTNLNILKLLIRPKEAKLAQYLSIFI